MNVLNADEGSFAVIGARREDVDRVEITVTAKGHRVGLLALHLAVATTLLACSKPPPELPSVTKDGTPVVAMVGEEPITLASLQVVAAQNGYNLSDEAQRDKALRDAINNEILAAKAKELGYEDDPDIRRYVKSQAVQKLLLATVDEEHQGTVPTDDEIRAYYDANLAEFTPPTLAKAQVLALLKRSGEGQAEAFAQKLDAVEAAIAAKEIPFSELVNRYSDDPAAKTYAGMTNWLVKGEANKQYPEALIEAVFAADDEKAVAGPIEHNDWVYFVKRAELRDGETTGFAQAKGRIAQQMMRQRRLDAYNTFVDQLKDDVTVQSFPDKVAEELAKVQKQGGPPMGPVRVAK